MGGVADSFQNIKEFNIRHRTVTANNAGVTKVKFGFSIPPYGKLKVKLIDYIFSNHKDDLNILQLFLYISLHL